MSEAAAPAKVRWGIMSTAKIALKVFHAMKDAPNVEVVAVASRSVDRAKEWAQKRGIPKWYGDYDELLNDPNIDAVYIPLPTAKRAEWCIKAAEKKKHVLSEKPIAVNADIARQIVKACRDNGVQFMDGVMFMHHDRLKEMSKHIHEEKTLGELRRVTSAHTKPGDADFFANNIRVKNDLEPLGCLGDLAWYNIRISLWAFKFDMPSFVRATNWGFNEEGVLTTLDGQMFWEDGRTASFDSSFHVAARQWVDIAGEHSHLQYKDLCIAERPDECKFVERIRNEPIDPEDRAVRTEKHVTHIHDCVQEQRMVEHFSEMVKRVNKDGPGALDDYWPQISLKTQVVLDSFMASVGADGAKVPVPGVPGF